MLTALDPVDGPAQFANTKTVTARLLRSEFGEASNGVVETTLDVLKDDKPTSKPGSHFTYSSTETQTIVLLVEATTGQVRRTHSINTSGQKSVLRVPYRFIVHPKS